MSNLVSCVSQPSEEDDIRPNKPSKINSEIASLFRSLDVLAKKHENIEDHKITKDHFVSQKENLKADFAFKNGVYHITATLDLRRPSVHIKEAAWKAMVLSEAKRNLGPGTRCVAVYAAPPGAREFESHLELMRVHSQQQFNWYDPQQQMSYRETVLSALRVSRPSQKSDLGL